MNRLIKAFCVRRAVAPPVDARSTPTYVLLASLLLAVTTAFLASDFELKGKEWTWASILITLQVLVGMCLRGRGFAALGTAIEAPALLSAVCLTILLATFFLGANQRPLIDSSLARADELLFLGFQWPTAMIAFFEQRTLAALANFAYGTLDWQPGMLLLLLCARGAPERCWTFLFAWIVTLIIVVGIYAFAPGVGGYAFHGITAAEVPGATDPTAWRYPEILRSLRSGHLRQIDFDTMEGLVTFPSFHAGAAVLLGWGFWTLRWLRWPFAILNIAMFLSAVPIGGHYLVDLLAGGAVAAIGISMAKCLSARTEGRTFVVPGGVGQFACSGPITGKGSGAT